MNSADIRGLLKPMIDFSPALLRAGEIVDAAEAAEKRLPDIEKQIAALTVTCDELAQRKAGFEQRVLKARNEFLAETDRIKAAEDDLRASLPPIREQREALIASLDSAQAQRVEQIRELDKQIAAKTSERDAIDKDIKALKSKFAA